MNLTTLIAEHPTMTTDELIDIALPHEQIVRVALRDRIEAVRRNTVLNIEHKIIRPMLDGKHISIGERRIAMLAEFRTEPGAVPVAWGQATSDQHRQRASFLRGQAASIITTAVTHETAADILDAAGVTCLDELGEDSVAA